MSTDRLKEAAKQEEEALQKGYDEAVSENEAGEKFVEVHGKKFPLPASKPAWIDLFIARYGRGKDKEVPADKYLDFILNLLGDEMTDYIIETADNDFGNEDFQALISSIMTAWQPKGKKK